MIKVIGAVMLLYSTWGEATVVLDHRQTPNQSEWKYFLQQDVRFQKNLWHSKSKRNIRFSDWSWGWKILWLRACSTKTEGYCQHILARGFEDSAMVVRAEAIKQIAKRMQGSGNVAMLRRLQVAFEDRRNFRNRQLMFIHRHILAAMKVIGGKESKDMRMALRKRYVFSANL